MIIDGCQYQVPNGVQHAVASLDTAQVEIKDTRFNFLQLVPLGRSRITASRLTGDFECVVSDSARLELADIPSQPGAGSIWVWPTFMPGTTAVYSPPLPGYVDHFHFPPANSSWIEQSFQSWSLRLYERGTHAFSLIGGGVGNVENGYLGTWQNALPDTPYELRLTLRDSLMRKHEGRIVYY